jgi:hypothetical protein
MSYTTYFFWITLAPIVAINFGFLVWCIIWCIIDRRTKAFEFGDVVEFNKDGDRTPTPAPIERERRRIKWITFHWWINTWIWLFLYTLIHLGCSLVAFDYLPIGAGIPIFLILAWVAWILLIPAPMDGERPPFWKGDWKNKLSVYHRYTLWKIKKRFILFPVIFVIIFLAIFLPYYFFEGTCIASDPYEWSSRYTRSRLPKACDSDDPCNVYLTMTEEPSNSVFINFHTRDQSILAGKKAKFYWDTVSHSNDNVPYQFSVEGNTHIVDMRDFKRSVHFAHVTSLTPNTTYYFVVEYQKKSAERSFRTLPATGPVTFVQGGDMGVSDNSRIMNERGGEVDPAFAMVGGDIAYENGMKSCYRRWDDWLADWETYMIDSAGNQIQMMFSLGNHEGGGWGVGRSQIPYWFDLFPQNGDGELSKRSPYHSHRISDHTFIMILDSGIDVPSNDPGQLQFIRDSFVKFSGYRNSFAMYHAPLYPGFRPFDTLQSVDERTHWLPIFDEYNLTCGFENHDHIYKRSKRLRNGVETADGTLYVGDGTWGVTIRPSSELRWYMDAVHNENFVLKVVASSTSVNITSIGIKGEVFDSCDL